MNGQPQPRLGPLATVEWTEEQRALLRGHLARADRYLVDEPDRPRIPPILGLLARHPRIGGPWLSFNGALLEGGSLAARDRELLILRVGHRTHSRYLCSQHLDLGAEAGLNAQDLLAVREDVVSGHWRGRDRRLLHAADELIDDHTVSDETWSELRHHFDEQQILEVLFTVGSYVCLAMVLNSVGLEAGSKE